MKKLIALLLCVSLLACMGISAFAMDVQTEASETVSTIDPTDPPESAPPEASEAAPPESAPEESEAAPPESASEESETTPPESASEESEAAPPEDGDSVDTSEESVATPPEDSPDSGDKFADAAPAVTAEVTYHVTVTWQDMDFTYHAGGGTWDPETCTYQDAEPYWSATGKNDQRYGTITLSSDDLSTDLFATFSFTKDPSFTAGWLGMRFSDNAESLGSTSPKTTKLLLSADTKNLTVYAVPLDAGDIEPFEAQTTLGTVTIQIAPAWSDPAAPEGPEAFE